MNTSTITRVIDNEIADQNGGLCDQNEKETLIIEDDNDFRKDRIKMKIDSVMNNKLYKVKLQEGKELKEVFEEERYFEAKDKEGNIIYKWSTQQPQNVNNYEEKNASSLFSNKEAIDFFNYIFDDNFLNLVVKYTNERISFEKEISIDLYFF